MITFMSDPLLPLPHPRGAVAIIKVIDLCLQQAGSQIKQPEPQAEASVPTERLIGRALFGTQLTDTHSLRWQ